MIDKIKGSGVALVTPFNYDNSIDYDGLENLINHVIKGGIDYLVIMGTTGESGSLSRTEKIEVINFCKKINDNRVPIVLGIGGNYTSQVISDINFFDLEGITAILSVSPYYNKPTQEGIYQHYKSISKACVLPIIIYNVPGRTSSNISAYTTIRLAREFKNIVAIKEASGDMSQIMTIIKEKPSSFVLLSGDDALTLPIIYMGGEGVISVVAQAFPKKFSSMVNFSLSDNKDAANKLHYQLYDFYAPLYDEGNPVGVKACLEHLGICKAAVRLPLVKASNIIFNRFKILQKQ